MKSCCVKLEYPGVFCISFIRLMKKSFVMLSALQNSVVSSLDFCSLTITMMS